MAPEHRIAVLYIPPPPHMPAVGARATCQAAGLAGSTAAWLFQGPHSSRVRSHPPALDLASCVFSCTKPLASCALSCTKPFASCALSFTSCSHARGRAHECELCRLHHGRTHNAFRFPVSPGDELCPPCLRPLPVMSSSCSSQRSCDQRQACMQTLHSFVVPSLAVWQDPTHLRCIVNSGRRRRASCWQADVHLVCIVDAPLQPGERAAQQWDHGVML